MSCSKTLRKDVENFSESRGGTKGEKITREREKFLKNPYEAAKKLFTEARSGKLKCSKEELDRHVQDTYSDPLRNQPMPEIRGPWYPVSFRNDR